jgi:hypothetical protein
MMEVKTMLRPCFLVAMQSHLHGGKHHEVVGIEETTDKNGKLTKRVLTEEVFDDPQEYASANKVRNDAMKMMKKVCNKTAFSWILLVDREDEFAGARIVANQMVEEFNANSMFTKVDIGAFTGKVASDSAENLRAIRDQVQGVLDSMNEGIEKLSPAEIRKAALKAKEVAKVISSDQGKRIDEAVATARLIANQLAKRVEREGEDAAQVLADLKNEVDSLQVSRFEFLDLEDHGEINAVMPAASPQRFDAIDEQVDIDLQSAAKSGLSRFAKIAEPSEPIDVNSLLADTKRFLGD